ncbi:MAG: hypothetical protein RR582_06685, partial [Niameybacter sp.]
MVVNKRKKCLGILIGIFLLIIGGNGYATWAKMEGVGTEKVAGYVIDLEEITFVMEQNRSMIANEFVTKYGIPYDENFWKTKVEGITLEQRLYEVSLEECRKSKAQQILAVKWGLESDISYTMFLKKFNKENETRTKMLKEGQIIYGPKQYTLEQYYSYTKSNRESKLYAEIIKKEMINEEDITRYYEQNKERLYRVIDTYQLLISKQDEENAISESWSLEIDTQNMRTYSKRYPEFVEALKEVKQGEYFSIQNELGDRYLIECKEIK